MDSVNRTNSLLFEQQMTSAELAALRRHNNTFSKPAIRLINTGGWSFYVEYANGQVKYDYGCGSEATPIGRVSAGLRPYN